MQSFTIFDIVIVSITVLLGLKGLLRGFIKEIFGLVGIVGGIFIASRMASDVGEIVAPIFAIQSSATIKLIGFIAVLIGFWAVIYILGVILSKIFSASGLGLFDRILGFLFGSAKIFLIFSVIAYSLFQVKSFKELMNKKFANSITFPLLIETGGFIVKLDPSDFVKKVEDKISEDKVDTEEPVLQEKSFSQETKETFEEIKKTTKESASAVGDTIKKSIIDNITNKIGDEQKIDETKDNKEEGN